MTSSNHLTKDQLSELIESVSIEVLHGIRNDKNYAATVSVKRTDFFQKVLWAVNAFLITVMMALISNVYSNLSTKAEAAFSLATANNKEIEVLKQAHISEFGFIKDSINELKAGQERLLRSH